MVRGGEWGLPVQLGAAEAHGGIAFNSWEDTSDTDHQQEQVQMRHGRCMDPALMSSWDDLQLPLGGRIPALGQGMLTYHRRPAAAPGAATRRLCGTFAAMQC